MFALFRIAVVTAVMILVFSFPSKGQRMSPLAAPGDLDPAFGDAGLVVTPGGSAVSEAIQADGKIVVAGGTSPAAFFLMRYNTDGSLDSSFGDNGRVVTSAGGLTSAAAITIQPDGKIVGAGSVASGSAVVRFNVDGSLDNSFANGGTTGSIVGNLRSVVVQGDGKIVAAGDRSGFLAVRLNADGTFDNNFGSGGVVVASVGGVQIVYSSVIDENGRIVISGTTNALGTIDIAVVAFTSSGVLDAAFGSGGTVITQLGGNQMGYDIAIHESGYVVTGHNTVGNSTSFILIKYTHDGVPDTQFGSGGVVTTTFNMTQAWPRGLAIQPDNKIIAAGRVGNGSVWNIGLARYQADGSLDSAFGTKGLVITPVPAVTGFIDIRDVQLQQDGKPVVVGSGGSPSSVIAARYLADVPSTPTGFDYDGDGRADVSVFRPSEGNWYRINSGNGQFVAANFGVSDDVITPADFDGDGRTDIAVFRPSDGNWYMLNSGSGTFSAVHWGISEDRPFPADFNGDGRADLCVFRPSTEQWHITFSNVPGSYFGPLFGTAGDIPLVMDPDGDGNANIAVFRPGNNTWYIGNNLTDPAHDFTAIAWGQAGDQLVPADYDGDGRDDVCVFRPSDGIWYRLDSSNGQFVAVQFGTSEDLPTAADFDGDGRADVSVFRPSNGVWYRLNSGNGSFFAVQFGSTGDKPTPSAFRY